MAYLFYKFHKNFFLTCAQKSKYTAHDGTKTLKCIVRTTLPLAHHCCNNLTHTSSKTCPKGCNCNLRDSHVLLLFQTVNINAQSKWGPGFYI